MNPTVIRFPTAARLNEPMATRLPWYRLMWRKWFGHKRPRTWNSVKFDHARRGR